MTFFRFRGSATARASDSSPPSPSSAGNSRRGTHLAFLDGVRGVACLYVMLHHCFLDLPASVSALSTDSRALFSKGHWAVDVFIVLSGYCLMLPIAGTAVDVHLWPFIRRRAVRILPTYYAALAFSLLLTATLVGKFTGSNWDNALPIHARDILLHVLMLHEWSTRSAFHINTSLWSIGVEWKIYFLFPALVALRNRRGAAVTALVAVAGGYAVWGLISAADILNPSPWGSSPYYVGMFAMGMWAADASTAAKARALVGSRAVRVGYGVATLLLLALPFLPVHPDGSPTLPVQLTSGFVGLWAASGLALLHAGAFPIARRLFTTRPLVALGKIGYTAYLIHAPIAQFVYQYVVAPSGWSDPARTLAMPMIFIATMIVVAVPFYLLFERPFHELSRRLWTDDRAPSSIRGRLDFPRSAAR